MSLLTRRPATAPAACKLSTEAVTQISAGVADLHLCVGVEVMSSYPLIMGEKLTGMFASLMRARSIGARLAAISKFRPSFLAPVIAITEGLTDPTCDFIMGKTAELIARDFGVTRSESDEYACQSHIRARDARERGRFNREIMPHLPLGAREGAHSLMADDGIRDQQTVEALEKMRPYFEKPDGKRHDRKPPAASAMARPRCSSARKRKLRS